MKQFNYEIGKLGEKIDSEYLVKKGYKILEQNFHTRFGEIDLVAAHSAGFHSDDLSSERAGQAKLVFVEVKLKIGEDFGTPEEMIDKGKMLQVEKIANFYVLKNPEIARKYPLFEIDAICIVLDEEKQIKRLNHYENINS